MFFKFFSKKSNTKNIRIKADVNNPSEKYVSVQLKQSFDFLEVLSLKLSQTDAYRLFDSDYGIVVGRVIGNEGVGLPNCKVSIFIPIDEEDQNASTNPGKKITDFVKIMGSKLYPFEDVDDESNEGVRYNLLPNRAVNNGYNGFPPNEFGVGATPKTPVGTFPTKEEILTNPSFLHVYDKYYRYSTVTNESGDFMIFGVPTGAHMLHMDCDITDIGKWSMSPSLMVKSLGYPESLFSEDGSKIEPSSDLGTLPNIQSQNVPVTIKPFWSQDPENTEVGVVRQDFRVTGDIVPSFSMFMNGITMAEDAYIGDSIIFRLTIGSKLFFSISIPVGISLKNLKLSIKWKKIEIYLPTFEMEAIKDKPCQICGGLYDLPPIGLLFNYNPFGDGDQGEEYDSGDGNDPVPPNTYVNQFNTYLTNNVVATAVTTQADYQFYEWFNSSTYGLTPTADTTTSAVTETVISLINRRRKAKDANRPDIAPVSTGVYYQTTNDPAFDRENVYQMILGNLPTIRSTEGTASGGTIATGTTYSASTDDIASRAPDEWTNKFDFETFRSGKVNVQLFSILDTVEDIYEDIINVPQSEYVMHYKNGLVVLQVACNKTRVVTTEDGRTVVSDDQSKGIFSEFTGYMVFDLEGNLENPATRKRTARARIKVPQSKPIYLPTTDTINEEWIKESFTFKFGEVYTVAQYLHAIAGRFEDRVGHIAEPHSITGYAEDRVTMVNYGFNSTTNYTTAADDPDGANASIPIFEKEWLNGTLYFPQFMYKTKKKRSKNFVCGEIIENNKKQITENGDPIGGRLKNTQFMLNGSKYPTAFVKVYKNDFVNFYRVPDYGFTSQQLSLDPATVSEYKSIDTTKKYFYKGLFADAVKFLHEKNIV